MIIKKFIVYVKDCGIIKFQRIQRTTNKGACSECQCILDKLLPINIKRILCGSGLYYHYYKNPKVNNNYIYVAKKDTLL